jgi:hypothetical protein
MKILVLCGTFLNVRNLEAAIRVLADRGHRIHLAANKEDRDLGGNELVETIARDHSSITYGLTPPQDRVWLNIVRPVRHCLEYMRQAEAAYQDSPLLVARWERRAPRFFRRLADFPAFRSRAGRSVLTAGLLALERAFPIAPSVRRFLAEQNPDVVILTPLITLGSTQLDYLREARELRLRTVFSVDSWDNLTSKALLRELPDLVIVWNQTQKHEAVRLHGVPPGRVAVTGAQPFDHWFDWRPSRSREEFCRQVGLDPDRPYVLYVCSSLFREDSNEVPFVERWCAGVRGGGDARLRAAGVLVRPHPRALALWDDVDLGHLQNVAVWPRSVKKWGSEAWKQDYFDSIYHSAAVVGVNTSALIEAGIVGRPVYTMLAPEMAGSQVQTLHFRYLLEVGGGLLHTGGTVEEHLEQLADGLANPSVAAERGRRFVEKFVRPHGLAVAAAPAFADAVEQLTGQESLPARRIAPWTYPLRLLWYFWYFRKVRQKRKRKTAPIRDVRRAVGITEMRKRLRRAARLQNKRIRKRVRKWRRKLGHAVVRKVRRIKQTVSGVT